MKNKNDRIEKIEKVVDEEKKESLLDRTLKFQVMLEEFRGNRASSDEDYHKLVGQFSQTLSNKFNESTKNITHLGVFVKIKSWLKDISTTPTITLPTKEIKGIRQGEWTYEDYLHLPNDNHRYEIIEGVLYISDVPDIEHQSTVTKIVDHMKQFATQKQPGYLFTAPFEVHLSENIRPIQPDVFFIKAEKCTTKIKECFKGLPDLIVEVLSPNTRRIDQFIKFGTYEKTKIPEYWIVDPKAHLVQVYILNDQEYMLLGNFMGDEVIESKILGDFKIIADSLFN
ncbi:Uma2 family endonuclease [Candidatus Parabeggiatoa sp. HSG14]|uniref:Uma2 family endonuclease n=1 Tax=Candidatus Parabeggiatoa sp. HSG14 TaxID=3055593 RepID=UPI0025A8EB02|nr:Uma2 family endonuclease [Thiotrichales bacterium HSG14]